MLRRVIVGVAVFSLWAAAAHAQPQIKKEPIKPVTASDGAAMFQSYCAACHGKAAKGECDWMGVLYPTEVELGTGPDKG